MTQPSYVRLHQSGELRERVDKAYEMMKECELCPHLCRVDREVKKGSCRAGLQPVVSDYSQHFGEEKPLVGTHGSGTIFFAYCNMKCVFCQNYDISYEGLGNKVTANELADIMLILQSRGCHNINLVTPTHFVPGILEALDIAVEQGLKIPLVYNCGGYERVETLKILENIVDIYMPDVKYNSSEVARMYSGVSDYPKKVKLALKEMYSQVGALVTNDRGIAVKGMIVRHLVLPEGLAGTKEIMEFIAKELSPEIFVNIMEQYYPAFKAHQYMHLSRRITSKEYKEALKFAKKAGIVSGDLH